MDDTQEVINLIQKGWLDDHLVEVRQALDTRLAERKAEVLNLVKDVYGEHADIVLKR